MNCPHPQELLINSAPPAAPPPRTQLLNSPAHEAGINERDHLLFLNGIDISKAKHEQVALIIGKNKHQLSMGIKSPYDTASDEGCFSHLLTCMRGSLWVSTPITVYVGLFMGLYTYYHVRGPLYGSLHLLPCMWASLWVSTPITMYAGLSMGLYIYTNNYNM